MLMLSIAIAKHDNTIVPALDKDISKGGHGRQWDDKKDEILVSRAAKNLSEHPVSFSF